MPLREVGAYERESCFLGGPLPEIAPTSRREVGERGTRSGRGREGAGQGPISTACCPLRRSPAAPRPPGPQVPRSQVPRSLGLRKRRTVTIPEQGVADETQFLLLDAGTRSHPPANVCLLVPSFESYSDGISSAPGEGCRGRQAITVTPPS